MFLKYNIDGNCKTITVPDNQKFDYGSDIILSNLDTDVAFNFEWYIDGYTIQRFISSEDFNLLKFGIEHSIKKIIEKELDIEVINFKLEDYHKWITNKEDHLKIVSLTRDLFSKDFNFDIECIIPKLEKILKLNLTDFDEVNNYKSHIIVRINRPKSTDFNPPHKDIYEHFENENYVPKFVNFWIPICGVSKESTLPICPGSHLIPESQILKTSGGSEVNGDKYRVSLVKEWAGDNKLIKPDIMYGEALIFSPHIIHGLSLNEQENITRVSLEFRLYEKKLD